MPRFHQRRNTPGLVAAWFAGTKERELDVGIRVSRKEHGKWTESVEVVNGVQSSNLRYPCWNPVLFQPREGPLMLFYKVGPHPREWWGMLTTSDDGGKTWTWPTKLGEAHTIGHLLGPVKNKPIQLEDGTILCPSSTEVDNGDGTDYWRVHFELTKDLGKTWEVIGPIQTGEHFHAIQPSILTYGGGRMQILCRSRQKRIVQSWSHDEGRTWSNLTATDLPNPNSGTDALTLKDGRQLVIYNHSEGVIKPENGPILKPRRILNLAVSDDGETWKPVLTFEHETGPHPEDRERKRHFGEYSYPAIIQAADGLVHIVYTYNREGVKIRCGRSHEVLKSINATGNVNLRPCIPFLLCLFASLAAVLAEPRPNIVLIVADDLGYGDLQCYGSETNETPHIDALAAAGLRFTDFHSAGGMCSPTRASLMTGRYPQRFGTIFDGALSGTTQRDLGLPLEAVTIAELLKQQGYATGCFGKWHLGYQAPLLPTNQGFDVFRGLVSGDGDFHTQVDRSGNQDWWHNEEIAMEDCYTTELLTGHSVEFIEAHREDPFFLYVPHLAIHFPWQGQDDPPQRTPGKSWHKEKWGVIPNRGNVAPHVKAMIKSLDASVGTIVAALRKWDLEKNTIVVFTSDNGGYLTYGKDFRNISSNGPWRGQKVQLYEGGHRVPMIVSWHARISPGVTEEIAHSNDLFPTILGLSGAKPVESDGVDLTPLWFRRESLPQRELFWRTRSHRAVRSGPWKMIGPHQPNDRLELYHLGKDLSESENLAKTNPKSPSGCWKHGPPGRLMS